MLRNSFCLVKHFLVFKLALLYDDKCLVRPADFEGNTLENWHIDTSRESVEERYGRQKKPLELAQKGCWMGFISQEVSHQEACVFLTLELL